MLKGAEAALVIRDPVITGNSRCILDILNRLNIATLTQIGYWLGHADKSKVSRLCKKLENEAYIESSRLLKPFAFRLSSKGANYLGASYKSAWPSFAATQQIVLKNEVEMQLRSHYPKSVHIRRQYLWKLGLSPALGEYAFKNEDQLFLVLLDDYLMDSKRILHCLTRNHSPNQRYYDATVGGGNVTWQAYADKVFVFCCDAEKLKQHQAFLDGENIVANCQYLPATWGIAV